MTPRGIPWTRVPLRLRRRCHPRHCCIALRCDYPSPKFLRPKMRHLIHNLMGYWNHHCLFVVCCLLLVVCCLLFVCLVFGAWCLAGCCLLFAVCLLFVACCLLFVVCCLLVACCLLFGFVFLRIVCRLLSETNVFLRAINKLQKKWLFFCKIV